MSSDPERSIRAVAEHAVRPILEAANAWQAAHDTAEAEAARIRGLPDDYGPEVRRVVAWCPHPRKPCPVVTVYETAGRLLAEVSYRRGRRVYGRAGMAWWVEAAEVYPVDCHHHSYLVSGEQLAAAAAAGVPNVGVSSLAPARAVQ